MTIDIDRHDFSYKHSHSVASNIKPKGPPHPAVAGPGRVPQHGGDGDVVGVEGAVGHGVGVVSSGSTQPADLAPEVGTTHLPVLRQVVAPVHSGRLSVPLTKLAGSVPGLSATAATAGTLGQLVRVKLPEEGVGRRTGFNFNWSERMDLLRELKILSGPGILLRLMILWRRIRVIVC